MLARLSASAVAALALASASNAALVYGGGTETGSRYNPGSVGASTYMNCFTAVGAGQTQLSLESAIVGIRRIATAGALLDVGIKIYAAEMTFDGTNFGRGANYLLYSSASLGGGAASVTQLVNTGAVTGVTLNLETASNAGLGGWWIGVEFTGANAANSANGWRVVNAPTTGASVNAFGIFNRTVAGVPTGTFEAFFAFGTPPGSSPSRMMVDVNGTLVPAPGALALLGVGGLAGARRRR
jgi:MYXO-CTERM domain-containing protein